LIFNAFIFDFKGLKKHFRLLFLSSLFIAIIDVFHMVSKKIFDNSDFKN